MEQVYRFLLAVGYAPKGIEWVRKYRLSIIIFMATAAWALIIGVGWLIWQMF